MSVLYLIILFKFEYLKYKCNYFYLKLYNLSFLGFKVWYIYI